MHFLGNGGLLELQALARQDQRSHVFKGDTGKCLHYYFYFIDPELGLCYLRVPSWDPFRLQFYYNGHGALEAAMRKRQIEARLLDNAFVHVADWLQAQSLAEQLKPEALHRKLDHYERLFCPPVALFDSGYSNQ
jgi:hypothetical protein